MFQRGAAMLAAALALAGPGQPGAFAQTVPPADAGGPAAKSTSPLPAKEGSEIQVFIENDVWARTDRYYTNGLKVGFGVPGNTVTQAFKEPTRWLLDRFNIDRNFQFKQGEEPHFGVFVGQNLYTPRQITTAAPQPLDRPWAGWLYMGVVAQRERGNRLDSAEIDVGVIGPVVAGEFTQTEWHKLIGSPRPQGWDNQLRNEPAFVATYLQKRRFDRHNSWLIPRHVDVIPHFGASVGTVLTLARAGGMIRVGSNMSDFGPDTIEPGGAMLHNTRRAATSAGARREPLEWYAFLGVDHRLVAHNIFLDGGAFRDGPGVDRRSHVYDFSRGISVRYQWFRFSLTRVRRSEEFSTPLGSGKQNFDSINIGFEF